MTLLSGELLIPLEKCKMETSLRSYRTSLGQVLGDPGLGLEECPRHCASAQAQKTSLHLPSQVDGPCQTLSACVL